MTGLPDNPAVRWFLVAGALWTVLAAPALALLPWSSPVTAAVVSVAVVVAYVGGYHLAVGGGWAVLRGEVRGPRGPDDLR